MAWENRAAPGPGDSMFAVGGVLAMLVGTSAVLGILGAFWARKEGGPGTFVAVNHFVSLAAVWFLSAFAAAAYLHWDEAGQPVRDVVPSGTSGAVQYRNGITALAILLLASQVGW